MPRTPLDRGEREIREEIRFYLDERTRELIDQGLPREEARRRAVEAFGNADDVVARVMKQRGLREAGSTSGGGVVAAIFSLFRHVARDLRHSLRALGRSPGFTSAAVLTLAVGVGACSAVFTLVDAILIRPLPYADSDRLVALRHTAPGLGLADAGQSDGTYLHYRTNNRVFEDVATYYENVVNLTGGDGEAERVAVAMVSPSLFSVLGAQTAVGRIPTTEELASSDQVTVLISYDLWRRRFGADPALVGRTIAANGAPRLVAGVLEPDFAFPRREVGIWYPSDVSPTEARFADLTQSAVARLRPGVSVEQASEELNRLIPSLAGAFPDATEALIEESGLRAVVAPLKDVVVGEAGTALWTLLGAMGFLLLIACANVVNLFLVRAEHRQKEAAVRTAIGARRSDVAGPVLAEGALIGATAALLALVVANAAVRTLLAFGPPNVPRLHEIQPTGRGALFTLGLGLGSGLLFGLITLLRAQPPLTVALKHAVRGATAGRQRLRVRRALVAAQIALALALLVGSALMLESFRRLRSADVGFDSEGVLTAEIALPFRGYERYELAFSFWERLLADVRAHPAVETAGAASGLPLVPTERFWDDALTLERRLSAAEAANPTVTFYHVTPGYFETLRIPVVAGTLPWQPGTSAVERPLVVSAEVAGSLLGSTDRVGERLRRGAGSSAPWNTTAAVVGDVPERAIGGPSAKLVYIPMLETPPDEGWIPGHMTLVVRTSSDPEALASEIRRIVREIDPKLPVANVRTLDRIVAASMARTSFAMLLLLVAGGAALLLGTVGVYSVTSYTVSRRSHEVGIRIALGAPREDVERMVVRESTVVAAVGVLLGAAAAFGLTRFLRALLYQVSPLDPVVFGGTALLLLATALLASWLPARRAARTDPLAALRSD